jgi:hypothetical protein
VSLPATKAVYQLPPAELPILPTDSIVVTRDGVNLTQYQLSNLRGPVGPVGPAGPASFTTLTAAFTQPVVNGSVSVSVVSTGFMVVGEPLFVAGGGSYSIANITSPIVVVLTNLGYMGNAAPGVTVVANNGVAASGVIGLTGPASYTTTTALFVQPSIGSNVSVQVATTAFMVPSQTIFVAVGGYYAVASITSATIVVLTNLGYAGNAFPTVNIPFGGSVASSGIIGLTGSTGLTGQNSFSLTTASFVQPAVSASATVQIASSTWMALNQVIYVAGGGYYTVLALPTSSSVTLTNNGNVGNAAAGTTVISGVQVVSGGVQDSLNQIVSNTQAAASSALNAAQSASLAAATIAAAGIAGAVFSNYAAAFAAYPTLANGQSIVVIADETQNYRTTVYQANVSSTLLLDFVNGIYQSDTLLSFIGVYRTNTFATYPTYAAALADYSLLVGNQSILITADETMLGRTTLYTVNKAATLLLDFINGVYQSDTLLSYAGVFSSNHVPVPANSSAPGQSGDWASDDTYFYYYGATKWLRVSGSTF